MIEKWSVAIAFILAGILALVGTLARAQPQNQTFSVLMCPTGQVDGFGNPIVAPCGNAQAPVAVQQYGQQPPRQSFQCKPNPLSGRVPPLC